MADFIDKPNELKRYFPKPFYNLKEGQGLSVLLEVEGSELNTLAVQSKNAREQFLLATAFGIYLDEHGTNVDVFRPRGFNMPDNVYRELIKIVTNSSKNIERVFERILVLFFGENAVEDGVAAVSSVRPKEIIVEIQEQALIIASSRDLFGTHYLHYNSSNAFDGVVGGAEWSGTLPVNVSKGDTVLNLPIVPAGMPLEGTLHFGGLNSPIESSRYTRVGNIVTFVSTVDNDHSAGTVIEGPVNPDDYPSGYIYDEEIRTDLVGSFLPGATAINIGVFPEKFPLEGTVYIGNPTSGNFEAKGFSRATINDTAWTLKGPLAFPHSSGDAIVLPNMPRKFKTTLQQVVNQGNQFAELTVANGADFGLQRGAIKLAQSFGNEEIVPFISRKISDNTKLLIDPDYTFLFDHAVGEKVQLMARKTRPSVDGLNYPFYLNDTDALRAQFFNLLRRLKATSVRMVFEIIETV